ncbi:unnamed protein product [Peronospora belbahrii]|uniref:Uncharacterized protein n=1 Tax=Peronospora belbahrii TaxID=622444 RepID=A0AAU9KTS6_9STRA|nr:unnamed protein product [Peronospora belbahrii]
MADVRFSYFRRYEQSSELCAVAVLWMPASEVDGLLSMADTARFANREKLARPEPGVGDLAEADTESGSEALDVTDKRWFETSEAVSVMLPLRGDPGRKTANRMSFSLRASLPSSIVTCCKDISDALVSLMLMMYMPGYTSPCRSIGPFSPVKRFVNP